MFRTTLHACFAALLLLALPASAESTWDLVPGSGDGKCTFDRYDICFSDFDANENSPKLDTRKCENYTVHFDSDIDDTTYDTTINIRWSVSASETVSVNTSNIVDNLTLNGNPATGLDVIAGYDAPWIWVDVANFSAGDVARVSVQCWKRRW